MNWGKSIVMAFVLFASFLAILAVRSFRSDINLVSKDYYRQELRYQDQIEKIQNERALAESVSIKVDSDNGALKLDFPPDLFNIRGTVVLYRPADASEDRQWVLDLDAKNTQRISLAECLPGLWKLQLDWESGGVAYYKEKSIYLP